MEKSEANSEGDNPRPWQSYHTVYTNAKAGMDGVDKEKVQRVVYEMSKGSKYFENEKKKEAILRQKIDDMNARCTKLTSTDMSHFQKVADKKILELETTRDLTRIWLHVDMDAFYAAVETLCNPSLKGKPMAVGGMSMISTANYEARKFGVRAAMPGFIAKKLCPEMVFVPTDFKKYTFYSDLTRKVFEKYDSHFMAASLDEAYLDITEVCRERGISGDKVAAELRSNVHKETGLTCSAGVAPNRLLAKVCSDINKPNGQFVLPNNRMAVMTFISSLPIRKIGGIGKVTESILSDALGIKTCEDMLQKGGFLCALFSRSTADFFLSVGLGLGGTDTPQVRFRKSISSERTFPATDDEALLFDKLADIAEMLCADMKKEGLSGRTLTLKLKTSSFEVRSRAVTLPRFICLKDDILKNASKLLKAELPASLRLMGLRMSHFNEETADVPSDPRQKTLINFLGSQSASVKNLAKQDAFGTDTSDFHLMDDSEPSFAIDMCQHTSNKSSDTENPQYLEDHHCTSGDNLETETTNRPQGSNMAEKANVTDESEGSYQEPCQTGVFQLTYTESFLPGRLKRDYPSTSNNNVNNIKTLLTPPQHDQQCWIDDYKCSLCGVEMPPDFIKERTEHADFHLAEKLQEEESGVHSISPTPRVYPKNNIARRNRRKKQKPSQKQEKNRPIDTFFVKSNQNF